MGKLTINGHFQLLFWHSQRESGVGDDILHMLHGTPWCQLASGHGISPCFIGISSDSAMVSIASKTTAMYIHLISFTLGPSPISEDTRSVLDSRGHTRAQPATHASKWEVGTLDQEAWGVLHFFYDSTSSGETQLVTISWIWSINMCFFSNVWGWITKHLNTNVNIWPTYHWPLVGGLEFGTPFYFSIYWE